MITLKTLKEYSLENISKATFRGFINKNNIEIDKIRFQLEDNRMRIQTMRKLKTKLNNSIKNNLELNRHNNEQFQSQYIYV